MWRIFSAILLVAFLVACVQEKSETTTTTTTLPCNETDSGRDYSAVGSASGFNKENKLVTEEDYCLNSDQLIESFCNELGYVVTEPVSCKRMGLLCVRGACVFVSTTTTTTTSTTTTSSTTTTTILGECTPGSCTGNKVYYRCLENTVEGYKYVARVTVTFYCADAGTPEAKCKSKESMLTEDICLSSEVCVEGLSECQPQYTAENESTNESQEVT